MPSVKKSTLQSLLSGEPLPTLPPFDKNWSLKDYNDTQDNWKRKLIDYLRRLLGKFSGDNVINEIINNTTINNIQQFFTAAAQYGFGPVKIDVYKDVDYVDATSPFNGTKVGRILTSTLSFPGLERWPGVGDNIGVDLITNPNSKTTAIRARCIIVPDYSENYDVSVDHNDGCRLYLNGVLVIDAWDSLGTSVVTVPFTAGQEVLLILEGNNKGGSGFDMHVYWNSTHQTGGAGWDINYRNLRVSPDP